GVFDNGSATTTFAANANLTGSAYSSALNLYGGRYITKAIGYGAGSTPATVNLDGGTLEAAQSGEIFSSSANITVNLGSNGATIDTGTNTVTISRSITGSGTLTKAGSGELVFTVDPDFTGAIDVLEGTVTLPPSATSIECAGDTMKKTTSAGIVFYYSKEDNHWNAGGGSDTAWTTAANWDTAYEGGGNYVFRQNELSNNPATASFTGETSLKAGLWIENGSEEANAITFTGDGTASLKIGKGGDADQGLNVGTWLAGGYLKVENLAIQSCQDLDIGNWGVGGHLIVGSGATVTTLGASGEAKWVILGVEGAANNSSITIEEGGVLEAWHIQRYTTAGSSTINMNGGTLRALATEQLVGDYWSQGRYATIQFNAESAIDTQNHDVRIEAPVTGSGGLVKAGSGSLLISGDMSSFTGAITVGEGCGSVTIPAGTGATAGADTKYATGDDGTVTYTYDDGSLSVPADETIVWLGNARIKGRVDIAGTLLLGAPKDVPDCTLSCDFGSDSSSFGTYFTNAGGELSDGAINGRAAKYSDTFKVGLSSAKGCVSTFAVLQSHNTPNYENLFMSSDTGGINPKCRWFIGRHNNIGYWEKYTYLDKGDWRGTDGMYQNGVAGCPVTQSPFVFSCVGQWTRYSSDTIYLGALTAMTWGEVVLFSREVTDDERIGIEDYLMWKWGFANAYLPLAATNCVTMAAGSTLDLGGFDLTVSNFCGSGTVENGTLRTADGIYRQGEGALTIPAVDGATYVASSSRYVLTITGAAGKKVTIRFPADWHDENNGKYTPVYCDGTPDFVFEGTKVPLFSDGAGGWCIANTDTGSYGENTEDNADEDGFEDEDGVAFPGAQGWGRFAKGARASSSPTVYHVTNLNDSGAGSLRDAVSRPNRIVVFDVGGLIKINSRITFASNLYIAGQTAPGEGITVYGDGCSFSGASN
ncbi:MAG: hypothetical protein K6F50_09835, partial [Kiritimatiellae bacterium]|nr:hypothetical protein [Kiritimatiellia bacterium]